MRRALSQFSRFLTATIAAGVILRLTVMDHSALLAPLFYMLPLPVLAASAMLRIGCLILLKQRRKLLIGALVAGAIVIWSLGGTIRWHSAENAPDSIRVLCWNVGRGDGDWDTELADTLNRERPDIAGLIEAGGAPEDILRFWTDHCPDYQAVMLGRGLLCLTRGTVGDGVLIPLAGGGYAGQLSVRVNGQELTVVLVDIKSDPFRFRAAPLAALAHLVDGLADRPVLILGDFNTPSESVHFRPLRVLHREAFEIAGNGYAPTWPVPCPVLHLDQVWTNRHLRPVSCGRRWTSQSDHRPVVADISAVAVD